MWDLPILYSGLPSACCYKIAASSPEVNSSVVTVAVNSKGTSPGPHVAFDIINFLPLDSMISAPEAALYVPSHCVPFQTFSALRQWSAFLQLSLQDLPFETNKNYLNSFCFFLCFIFFKAGSHRIARLSWNLLCSPGWPQTCESPVSSP
jgi:hypothetical protein